MRLVLCLVWLAVGTQPGWCQAVRLPAASGLAFGTPVQADQLDPAAYAQWVDGREGAIEGSDILTLLSTSTTEAHGNTTLVFGDSKTPGARHLRIGFRQPVAVGSVLVDGGGTLSVLKPDAAYPGDLKDDAQWLPAQRLEKGKPSQAEVPEGHYDVWVLPPGTTTRALRFTHVAGVTDANYGGRLAGALVLSERVANEAPRAVASASADSAAVERLNNLADDGWKAWENQEKGKALAEAKEISEENPEWVALTWREPVKLRALAAWNAGFGKAEVQVYTGSSTPRPNAADGAWQSLGVFEGIRHNYPSIFCPNKLDFGKEVATRGVRLRLVAPAAPNSQNPNNQGKRVWLGELMAFRSLGDATLEAAGQMPPLPPPPIPVRFQLKEPGYVTLVIEKPDGFRVRNLISETWLPAGDNTVWWDGTDDLGRDAEAAEHGQYRVTGQFVEPGDYVVRGLTRGAITPRYEFSVYAPGNPPWSTADNTGAWLANHSAPQAATFVPAAQSPTGTPVVYLGCYVTEGPSGVAWVDLDGNKLGGKRWVGGIWTAAPFLARDAGAKAVAGVQVYVASAFPAKDPDQIELRLNALTRDGDTPVLIYSLGKKDPVKSFEGELGGMAVRDGVLVAALTAKNQLLFVDAAAGKPLGLVPVPAPRGVAFDASGRLLVLSQGKLLRFSAPLDPAKPSVPQTIVSAGLEDPVGLAIDDAGAVYVSDQGNSHQVKVYAEDGRLLRMVGKPGAPQAGPYDPLHLNHPAGLAVDSRGQLWIAENDHLPKRVSVWSSEGKLVRAFYGPAKYGGGGALDPQDKAKFYYADEGRGLLEFKLDWQAGSSELINVLYRADTAALKLPKRSAAPESPLYCQGRRYFTDAYNSSPVAGPPDAFLFAERDGVARPVAGFGAAEEWEALKGDAFQARWPEGTSPTKPKLAFLWSDLNDDGQVQPEEVQFLPGSASGITMLPDLSFCVARLDGKAMRFAPVSFGPSGVPRYDLKQGTVLAQGVLPPASSGGDQVLSFSNGWTALSLGIAPFSPLSVSGAKAGVPKWSYPNLWPGLHASHHAPGSDRPGQLIGTTRLLDGSFDAKGSDAGPFFALHSNHGFVSIFTQDGLFVANVFKDTQSGKSWRMPAAVRGMDLGDVTLGEEDFWPTITGQADGNVYMVDGARSSLVRLEGMNGIRRLPESRLQLDRGILEKCRAWRAEAEAARQDGTGGDGLVRVALRATAPAMDGKLDDWAGAEWMDVDKTKDYGVTAALTVAGGRLYAAWKTGNDKLLQNSGEMPVALFKTGGALDVMVSTDPAADPVRREPVAGDQRLLVTLVGGKPKALLYKTVVPGTKASDKVPFSSPWRTITLDRVDDVSAQVEFVAAAGNYEISIPLAALGLKPENGMKLKGDIGVLRGNGTETTARLYWNNKATAIVSDVPDEAVLTPRLWGTWEFRTP